MQKLLAMLPGLTEISAQLNFKNLIRNPNFDVWQRGVNFTAVAQPDYTADGFQFFKAGSMVSDITLLEDSPTQSPCYSKNVLCHIVTTPQSQLGVNQYCALVHKIEGYIARALWGQPFTLSFWVKASRTGIFSVSFRNGAFNKTWVTEYKINEPGVWERKVITVPALSKNSLSNLTNGLGFSVTWGLAYGSNYTTSLINTWVDGDSWGSNNQTNHVSVLGDNFFLSQIQLEVGTVATDFEIRPYLSELLLCKRYFNTLSLTGGGWTNACPNGASFTPIFFPVSMRTTPSALLRAAGTRLNIGTDSIGILLVNNEGGNFTVYPNQAATGALHYWAINDLWDFSAEL